MPPSLHETLYSLGSPGTPRVLVLQASSCSFLLHLFRGPLTCSGPPGSCPQPTVLLILLMHDVIQSYYSKYPHMLMPSPHSRCQAHLSGLHPQVGAPIWLSTVCLNLVVLSSVQFSRSVVSDSLRPHGLQHTRLPCPSPSPRVCSDSCPLSQ